MKLPVINISSLFEMSDPEEMERVAASIQQACVEVGFFYIEGHGVSEELQSELEKLSHEFFSLPETQKLEISMNKGGRAWRGYFPVGAELTSGKPDLKEGIYFGSELSETDPMVKRMVPMHGRNLFPAEPKDLKQTVLRYMDEVTKVGHAVLRGVALSLNLPNDYFESSITKDPFILFRIFHYPATSSNSEQWGVGEHTDYGLLTILKQDDNGGLEVRSKTGWISAPPIPNTFVCNIGDMLDRMTGGHYLSTSHRVRNTSGKNRRSFPLFFDPNFDTEVGPIPGFEKRIENNSRRWDGKNVYDFNGRYGDYVLNKVSHVFPYLFKDI